MNNEIFYFLHGLAHRSEILDGLIIFFAVYFPFLVVFSAGLFFLFHHEVFKAKSLFQILLQKEKEFLTIAASLCVAYISAVVLKILFHVSRPAFALLDVYPLLNKTTFSFPSEHATFFMALAFAIFFTHKKAGYVFMLSALLIGLARIVAGVHFPVDILAGFALGALVAYLVKNV